MCEWPTSARWCAVHSLPDLPLSTHTETLKNSVRKYIVVVVVSASTACDFPQNLGNFGVFFRFRDWAHQRSEFFFFCEWNYISECSINVASHKDRPAANNIILCKPLVAIGHDSVARLYLLKYIHNSFVSRCNLLLTCLNFFITTSEFWLFSATSWKFLLNRFVAESWEQSSHICTHCW